MRKMQTDIRRIRWGASALALMALPAYAALAAACGGGPVVGTRQ